MAAPAVLTGHKISLSYDRLLHAPNLDGGDGATVYIGLGNILDKMIINITADDTNGGFFVVNFNNSGYGIAGFQNVTRNVIGGGTTEGLSFMTDSTHVNTLWIGSANGQVAIGYINSDIPAEVSGYNLYVKDGITSTKRIKTTDWNSNAVGDLFISSPDIQSGGSMVSPGGSINLGTDEVYGVRKNDQIICSGTCFYAPHNANGHTCNIRNSDDIIVDSVTIVPSGGQSFTNYDWIFMCWQRVGGVVTVSFQMNDFYGTTSGAAGGLGRGMYLVFPVILLDDDNSTVLYPTPCRGSSGYFAAGSGVGRMDGSHTGYPLVVAEIKPYSTESTGFCILSTRGTDDSSDDSPFFVRGQFQYVLY